MSYAKLFSDIVTSSVWSEDDQTRILWITLLALANKHGEVMAAVPGLSKVAAISMEATERALGRLMGPDPYSRTPDDEGRRLTKIDGGWLIVNYEKHRERDSVSDVRSKNAERQRRFRERHKQKTVTPSVTSNGSVTLDSYNAEAKAEVQKQIPFSTDLDKEYNPLGRGLGKPTIPAAKKPRKDRRPTTEAAQRIAKLFGRRLTTAWADKEIAAFKAIGEIDLQDLATIEIYYERERAKGKEGIHRRDLKTFLNNYPGEVDRANLAVKRKKPSRSAGTDPAEDMGAWTLEGITEAEWRQKHGK